MNNDDSSLPPIQRFNSRQRENKLAKRLYKNNSMKKLNSTSTVQYSFLKNINPDTSILATNTQNLSKLNSQTSSHKNLLIPSISLKRHMQFNPNQKSLQISQGKILVSKIQQPSFLHYKGDLKNQLQKTSSPKHLFKKINRYEKGSDFINEMQYDNQKKIIPDELLGSSSDNQRSSNNQNSVSKYDRFQTSPKSKGSRLLKGFKSQTGSIIQPNQQQNLTPQDFIQLVQQDGSITNQFCYLKKMSHPYDLKIVQFQGRLAHGNPFSTPSNTIKPSSLQQEDQYITISSRGVSYFSKQNSRFVPLDRWKKQAYYFNKLMDLQFFSKYRLFKNFAKWKKHIRKTAMKSTTDKLKNQLLLGDKFLRKALLSTKDSCFLMENEINYIKFDDCENVMQFHKFKASQDSLIQNEFQKRISQIQEDIKNNLISNMSDSMREFKQQNKISTSNEGKGIPLLIGDQKNLDMPYTKQATLRIQQQRFKKFLKLIQFMIIDSKIKMMTQSTLNITNKINQQNESYEREVIALDYKLPFKGKQYIECFVNLNFQLETLLLKPTRQQLNYMFQDLVNKSIIKLCRNHKRIINDDDILEIIYDSNQKIVKEPETNNLKVIIMSDDRQQKIVAKLNQSINVTYGYLQKYSNRFSNLVQMYFQNLRNLQTIQNYEAKDYEIIKKSLQNWKNQLGIISSLSHQHEAAIFLLNFRQFKQKIIICVTQCLQKMKRIIPKIFQETTERLLKSLQQSLKKIQNKPFGIQNFIIFQNNKNQITNYLQDYLDRLSQIRGVWNIMKSYSSSSQMAIISKQQRQITSLHTILNNLRTKLQEAQMNTKFFQTKAQQQVKDMIPKINESISKLYTKINILKFDVDSNINQVTQSIIRDTAQYEKILEDIQKIINYQKYLNMETYNNQFINKFSNYFQNYKNIWKFRKQIHEFKSQFLNQFWMNINVQQTKKAIQNYFNTILKLKKKITNLSTEDDQFKIQLNDIDVLSYVFLEAKNMKPIIQTIECLRDKSLTQKQFKQIKAYFEKLQKPQVCAFFDPQNKQATVKQIIDLKISDQLDFIRGVVFKSKKQMEIHTKMVLVNKFWVQNGSNTPAGKNLAQNFEKNYWDILTEIDQKITVINGISQQSQIQSQMDLKNNISQNKSMFDTLRVLLTEWQQHQRYLHYFQPIFMNSYWKTTKQMKIYSTAENNWKKLLKQCKDYSYKKWASNQKAIITLRQNIALFQQLKKAVQQFLSAKRQIFPKFYLLSNQQLLDILLSQKQFKSVQKHFNKAFTCLKSLDIREQNTVPVGVKNFSQQYLPIRFARINNFQIQQIFRILQQSIKQSIRTNLKNCFNTFQKDQFNKKQWIKENLLQVLLFIQKSQYTKIIESDYFGPQPQDLSQYLIYQNSQIKQTHQYLHRHSLQNNNKSNTKNNSNKRVSSSEQSVIISNEHPSNSSSNIQQPGLQLGKLETIIFQQIQHRDITEFLLNNHVTQQQSYEWQKQIRCEYNSDSAVTKFLSTDVEYGCQFVSLQNSYPYVSLCDKDVIQLSMALKLKHSPVIRGRQNLAKNFAKYNARYYRNVISSSHLSQKYLLNVCFATYLEGCYVQFDSAQNLRHQQLSVIANFLKQAYCSIDRKDQLFSFGFGWKRSSKLIVHSGLIFNLSQSYVASSTQFTNKLTVSSRSLEFNLFPFSIYLDLTLQIRRKNLTIVPQYQTSSTLSYGSKLNKILELIKQIQGYQIMYFDDLKQICSHQNLQKIDQNSYDKYFSSKIIQLIGRKVVSQKKLLFYKKIVYELFYEDKNVLQSMISSLNNEISVPTKSVIDQSNFKMIVNNLVQITERRSICIVAGPTQSGKFTAISEAYRQKICRNFQVQILNVDILDQQSLFGRYINGLWKEGILINKLKQMPLYKQQWIVLEGSYSQRIQNIIKCLCNNHSYIQLTNGQIVSLSPQWKFIFSVYNLDDSLSSSQSFPKDIQIIASNKFLKTLQSLYLMMQKRIKPYFDLSNLQNYNLLLNMCTNNFSKMENNRKTGQKTDYIRSQNVLRYYINIMQSLLKNSNITHQIKKSKQFAKGIQKIAIWSLYWCIGSSLAQQNAKKYEALMPQNKLIEKSQTLGLMKLQFDTALGSFKKIKNPQIKRLGNQLYMQTLNLKSKANFVQLMIKCNFPIILIGKTGSGKSKFLNQYIPSFLNPQQYAFLPIRLRKNMTYEQFKDILFKKTRISIKHTKRKCFCSNTNKKLIIMIDDFNLLNLESKIGQFLSSCIKNGYHYDRVTNQKIYIQNISFVVAENQMYEFRVENRFLKYFKPVYIDEIELKDIVQVYRQQFDSSIQHGKQILNACVSMHNFMIALQSSGQLKNQYPLSQRNALRIIKSIRQCTFSEQNHAKIWAYVTKHEYTGFGVSDQVQQKIQQQIRNILNLIIQNITQKPKPVSYINNLINELHQKFSFLKSISNDSDSSNQFQQYYQFMSFLLSLSQPNNLLTVGEYLPQNYKAEILSHVAQVHSMKFYFIRSVQEFKKGINDFKNSIFYLSSQNEQNLMNILSYICNNTTGSNVKQGRYLIDFLNKEYFIKILKQFPSIQSIFHIHTLKKTNKSSPLNLLSTNSNYSSYYLSKFHELQSYLNLQIPERQSMKIIFNLYKQQHYIRTTLFKNKSKCQKFIANYNLFNQSIQKNQYLIEKLTQNIKNFQLQQQSINNKKKQISDNLIVLRNTKTQDQKDQQQRIKNIKNLQEQLTQKQNQLKNVKLKKLETSQKISSTQSLFNLIKELVKNLTGHYEDILQEKISYQKVQENIPEIIFLLSLYYYGLTNITGYQKDVKSSSKIHQNQGNSQIIATIPPQKYLQFVNKMMKQNQIDIKYNMKIIFNIQIDIKHHQQLFIWAMEHKSVNVLDQNNRFLRQIKQYVPKIRIYTQINRLLYDAAFPQPKIYIGKYDSRIEDIKRCTFIVNQKPLNSFNNSSSIQSTSPQQNTPVQSLLNDLVKFTSKPLWTHSKKYTLKVKDNQQNQKQVIKQFIYKNLEPVFILKQVQKYQQDILILKTQSWQQNQRIIQLVSANHHQKFINNSNEKQHKESNQAQDSSHSTKKSTSLKENQKLNKEKNSQYLAFVKELQSIKNQCKIFYSTQERIKPLKSALSVLQNTLTNKYSQIIDVCALFKGYIHIIEQNFKYFCLSDMKFNQLIIQSLIKKKPQERTRKKLADISQLASSQWNSKRNLTSKHLLGTSRMSSHHKQNNAQYFSSISNSRVDVLNGTHGEDIKHLNSIEEGQILEKLQKMKRQISKEQKEQNNQQTQINSSNNKKQQVVFAQKNQEILPSNNQNTESEQVSLKDIKQINIKSFKAIMIDFILSNIFIGLKSFDALIAYNILGCYLTQYNYGLNLYLHRKVLLNIMPQKNIKQSEIQTLLQHSSQQIFQNIQTAKQRSSISQLQEQQLQKIVKIQQIQTQISEFYKLIKQKSGALVQKLVQLGDKLLSNTSYDQFLHSKYDSQIINFRQNIIMISNENQNPYQILQHNILSKYHGCSWCYMFDQQIDIQKINQISQKGSINWLILVNNKNLQLFDQVPQRIVQRNNDKQKLADKILNQKSSQQKPQKTQKQVQKQLNIVFLYTKQSKFIQVKTQIQKKEQARNQTKAFKSYLCIYAEQNLLVYQTIQNSYKSNVLKFYNPQEPQIQQLLRIVFYDQTNRMLKNLYNYTNNQSLPYLSTNINKQLTSSYYYYTKAVGQFLLTINSVLVNSQNIQNKQSNLNTLNSSQFNNNNSNLRHKTIYNAKIFNHFVKFILNVCYPNSKEKQNIVLKQAKKIIYKNQILLNHFMEMLNNQNLINNANYDDLNFDGSSFIYQNAKNLFEVFETKGPQEIVNLFIPPPYRKNQSLDTIYFWNIGNNQTIFKQTNKSRKYRFQTKKLTNQQITSKIDNILNQLPILQPLQSQNNKKQKLLYKQILRDQIRSKINIIKKIQESLKKYKKLLQPIKILSQDTQLQLNDLQSTILSIYYSIMPNDRISISEFISRQQKDIQYLDKFYQNNNKQTTKLFHPSHFSNPASFYKYYLYQSNTHIPFKDATIQAKYLTQKDKQLHFDQQEECKSLTLGTINIKNNGKFDSNKNYLQINDKNQVTKILNVHVCLGNNVLNNLNGNNSNTFAHTIVHSGTIRNKQHHQTIHLNQTFNNTGPSSLFSLVPVNYDGKFLLNLLIINKIKDNDSIWKDKVQLQMNSEDNQEKIQ